ncbi:MAG: TAXI family TRAP transporter solute-binding subunit [Deltaproteobacteria bacterium]|nr:TAXI family TRAP transporter solute-binding subunit [Deltaproteobacteria bacterium]
MKRLVFLITLILIFTLIFHPAPAVGKVTRMVITTGSTGANMYIFAIAMTKIWHKKVKGVSFSVQSSAGQTENMKLLAKNEVEFGFIASPEAPEAMEGTGRFKGQGDLFKKMRGIYAYPYGGIQYVTLADSRITKMSDLKGKKISIGAPGSVGATLFNPLILKEHGITKDNATFMYLAPNVSGDQLKNFQIDALAFMTYPPIAQVTDVATVRKIRQLSLEEDAIQRIVKQIPGTYKETTPAKVYGKNQVNTEDIQTIGYSVIFATIEDIEANLIYSLTKAFWENIQEFHKSHVLAKMVIQKNFMRGMTVPLHKGAERYYKEVGWIK